MLAPLGKFELYWICALISYTTSISSTFFLLSNLYSTADILVVGADQEDQLVFQHVPLNPAQVHLSKPMVELVVDLVILLHQNLIVVEEVAAWLSGIAGPGGTDSVFL